MYGGGEENSMLPDLNMLEYFHFLRPLWGLLVIPWIFVFFMLYKMESGKDMFGGIIAPHLLEHLRLNQFQNRWANPRNFTKVIFLFLLIILMGPSWRQQPSPLIQDDATLVILLDESLACYHHWYIGVRHIAVDRHLRERQTESPATLDNIEN